MDFESFLGYFTGLRVLGGALSFPSLLVTVIVTHCLDSIVCRFFARNNGYRENLWTVLGFCFGIWAVAALLLFPKKQEE
ncbi:MAG: hypothetical protein HYZ50_15825 [Deltaproteobacteria bacterium]|nr:hypothetical protein [Deltaproteobacteria bacterium]